MTDSLSNMSEGDIRKALERMGKPLVQEIVKGTGQNEQKAVLSHRPKDTGISFENTNGFFHERFRHSQQQRAAAQLIGVPPRPKVLH